MTRRIILERENGTQASFNVDDIESITFNIIGDSELKIMWQSIKNFRIDRKVLDDSSTTIHIQPDQTRQRGGDITND